MTQLYLTRRQVAERYPISEHTLAKMASTGRGPRYYKPTDKVLYRPEDIEAWIDASVVTPLAETSSGNNCSHHSRATSKISGVGRGTRKRMLTFSDPPPTGRGRKSLTPSPESVLRKAE